MPCDELDVDHMGGEEEEEEPERPEEGLHGVGPVLGNGAHQLDDVQGGVQHEIGLQMAKNNI